MTVFDLSYSAWSVAFRILAMGVRSGFVQQQYSKSDVEAASEARKKGHNIAGDMRTQLLDAGENTVIKNALVNMADAIGSSVDAALSSGEVSKGKRGQINYTLLGMDLIRARSFEKVDKRIPALRAAACGGRSIVAAAPVPSRTMPLEALVGFSPEEGQ